MTDAESLGALSTEHSPPACRTRDEAVFPLLRVPNPLLAKVGQPAESAFQQVLGGQAPHRFLVDHHARKTRMAQRPRQVDDRHIEGLCRPQLCLGAQRSQHPSPDQPAKICTEMANISGFTSSVHVPCREA